MKWDDQLRDMIWEGITYPNEPGIYYLVVGGVLVENKVQPKLDLDRAVWFIIPTVNKGTVKIEKTNIQYSLFSTYLRWKEYLSNLSSMY